MRAAILTTLGDFDDAYSVKRVVTDQVWMLQEARHEVVLYVKQGFDPGLGTLPCIAAKTLPGFQHGDFARTAKEFNDRFGGGELAGYDVVLTHDLHFLNTHQGYREGIRRAAASTKAAWIHWSHSVPTPRQGDGAMVPGHSFVALNREDVPYVAMMYKAKPSDVDVCRNPSDATDTVGEAGAFIRENRLLDNDFLGVLPFSVGRLHQKGIERAVKYYSAIADRGYRVAVVLCASRCDDQKGVGELRRWSKEFEGSKCRIIWTAVARPEWAATTPNTVVRDLMRFSNLMIWPTIGEACSLAIAEAQSSGGPFVVLPAGRVRGMRELADCDTAVVNWQEGIWRKKQFRKPEDVAKEICEYDLERFVRRLWRQWKWTRQAVWEEQLRPILMKRRPGAW